MYSTVSGMVFSFNPIRLWMVAKKIFYGLKKTRGTNQKSEIKSATPLPLLGKKRSATPTSLLLKKRSGTPPSLPILGVALKRVALFNTLHCPNPSAIE